MAGMIKTIQTSAIPKLLEMIDINSIIIMLDKI